MIPKYLVPGVVLALQQLNASYGKGKIGTIDFKTMKFSQYVKITAHGGYYDWRRFRFVGDTVFALGHQRKIKCLIPTTLHATT